ncbi:MAG: two-component regulator propeller domain-containing protein, partial [Saprospiraceae bacterium]
DPKANLIYQDEKNNYWFNSKEKGVYVYDGNRLLLLTMKDGLCSNVILNMQEDKLGNIYFDTPEGVSKFDGQQFKKLKIIEDMPVNNKWKSEPDNLWFRMGWDKSGPYRFDGNNLHYLEFPKNKMGNEFYAINPNASYNPYGIYSMYKDKNGNIWFGTSNAGIYRFDGEKVNWMYEKQLTETPGGGSFGIRSIVEDNDGYFWICNSSFKYKVLPDTNENFEINPINYKREIGIENKGKSVPYFLSMVTDNKGDLWMTTYDNGVWRKKGEELIQYPVKEGVRSILLSFIYKDKKGVLWLGTQTDGSYKFNGDTFVKFKMN